MQGGMQEKPGAPPPPNVLSKESISVQGEHRRQGVPKRMLTTFSGSTGDTCGLVILRLGRLDGPLEFSACGRASGKADGAAFLAGKQGG